MACARGHILNLQRYLHSRPQDAAQVALEARAGALVLVHYSGNGQEALARARETFAETRLGEKGMRVRVEGPGQVEWV